MRSSNGAAAHLLGEGHACNAVSSLHCWQQPRAGQNEGLVEVIMTEELEASRTYSAEHLLCGHVGRWLEAADEPPAL